MYCYHVCTHTIEFYLFTLGKLHNIAGECTRLENRKENFLFQSLTPVNNSHERDGKMLRKPLL